MILDDQIATLTSDNHLLINFKPLNKKCILTNWSDGIHFFHQINKCWKPEDIDPGFILISDEYSKNKNSAAYHYMQEIPKNLQNIIKPFTQNQFTLLRLFSLSPSLIDIFYHSPNLVWMAAVNTSKKQWPLKKIITLIQKKREQIIIELFQSDSRATVNFINKIQLLKGDQYEYRLINECCNNSEIIRFFYHWKKIPVHALVLLRKHPILMKTGLLPSSINTGLSLYRQQTELFPICSTLSDIKRMAQFININLPDSYYKNIKTVSNMNRAHDRLVDTVNNSEISANSKTNFYPLCPLGNTYNIIQLKNSVELASEGRIMHNCVAGYGPFLLEGNSFIYKVINPERGTVHIKKNGEHYDINQFKLMCNKEPSINSVRLIRNWLSSLQNK